MRYNGYCQAGSKKIERACCVEHRHVQGQRSLFALPKSSLGRCARAPARATMAHAIYQARDAVREIANAIRPSFGPLGMDAIIIGQSNVLTTNSGSTIMNALEGSDDAVGRWLRSVLHSHSRSLGDGSIGLVVMLESALTQICAMHEVGAACGSSCTCRSSDRACSTAGLTDRCCCARRSTKVGIPRR